MQISAKVPADKMISLEVKHSDSMEIVKAVVQSNKGISPVQQKLLLDRKESQSRCTYCTQKSPSYK